MKVENYSRLQIVLHWLVAVLLVGSYLSSDAMKDGWRAFLRGQEYASTGVQAHVIFGITILTLLAVRLILRYWQGVPDAPVGGSPLLARAAGAMHWALYAVLILIPVSGMLAWFGEIRDAGDVHEVLFNVLIALVAMHTAAALFHHYVLRDGLLRRMIRFS